MAASKQGFASLPMYDWPELRDATDAFWGLMRAKLLTKGIECAQHLSRDGDDAAFWTDPKLLLGQTCGYPLATGLRGKVKYLTTPVYTAEGCEGARYSSAIVVHRCSAIGMSTLAGRTFVYNSESSLSGFRAMRATFGEPSEYFGQTTISGGHRQSARMVASGSAEVAAIDAVCWQMLQKYEAETSSQLRVIGWTTKRPALPMITSLETNDKVLDQVRDALNSLVQTPELLALNIAGFTDVPISDYHALSSL